MGYPERLLTEGELIVSQFRPHWLSIAKEGLLVLGALVAAGLVALEWGNGWVVSAIIVVAVVIAARGLIRWLTTLHAITNERVIYRAGLISKKGKEIPLENVNDVAFSQTVIERLFGTGDLLIESAGTHGQSHYTDIPKPEQVQSLIYKEREERKLYLEGRSPSSPDGVAAQLMKLAKLHDDGKLTDAEFASVKAKLLGGG